MARIIAVGPVALPRPKTAKPAPPKAADFQPLNKKTPVQQVQKPVKQKNPKQSNQPKVPSTKEVAPVKEPASVQPKQLPLETTSDDLEPFYRSRASIKNARRKEKMRMERERKEQVKLAHESARTVTPPPPQNPPSVSSSPKKKTVSPKESL